MSGADRTRMARTLRGIERETRLAQLRDREASLETVIDGSRARLDAVRKEIEALENGT